MDSNTEDDDQPLEFFRSRSKTWPIKEPDLGSSSVLSSRLPSISLLNGATWNQDESDNYTNSPTLYSTQDNNSNQSLDNETNGIGPEKPKRTRRRNDSSAQKKVNPWYDKAD